MDLLGLWKLVCSESQILQWSQHSKTHLKHYGTSVQVSQPGISNEIPLPQEKTHIKLHDLCSGA